MSNNVHIRQAAASETEAVSAVLHEAATWLRECGVPMWKADELSPDRIANDVVGGMFLVAVVDGEIAGVVKFQLEDELFWPDVPRGGAAYVHRLAVKRAFAGRGISTALLEWAVCRTRELGRPFLRLDTDAARPKLRSIYERFGFRHHSDRQVGPYFVARYQLEIGRCGNMNKTAYTIREGFDAMDFARVHAWLAATYWTPGIARERVEHGARNSALVIGAFDADGTQVGFARVVSDKSRFAYLCDVVVDEGHRRRGIARAMVAHALAHPDFATPMTWTLATRDAHAVYGPLGFRPVTDPESRPGDWMVLRRKVSK